MTTADFEDITKKASITFYSATLLFPKKIRQDVFILYAYVRTVDDYIDSTPPNINAFKQMRSQTVQAFAGKQVKNDLVNAFVGLAKRKNFKKNWVWSFYDSQLLDYKTNTYTTQKDLDQFVYGVAEVIGLFMSSIIELPKSLYPSARDLGHAMQMVNILRDIREDHARGKTYIPQTDLTKFHIQTLNPKTKNQKKQYASLIEHEISRIQIYMNRANIGISKIPKRYRVAIRSAYNIYSWYLSYFSKYPEKSVAKVKTKPTKGIILTNLIQAYYQTYILNI